MFVLNLNELNLNR